MLTLEGVKTSYGKSRVLFGVNLEVKAGEVVTLMGRNGMGKTTTVHSIFRFVKPNAGRIVFDGRDISNDASHRIARAGLGLVPEGRRIFATLSAEENLLATARGDKRAGWSLQRVYELFPRLKERASQMGRILSGGEQQMLAVGRALMTNPRLLILDEATEGLAPLIRQEIWTCLHQLKAEGQSILVIDKNIAELSRIADQHFVLEKGQVVWQGSNRQLLDNPDVQQRYLGV